MSYEYQIIEWRAGDTVFDLVDKLNGMGRHGWRVINIYPVDPSILIIFLERPLAESPARFTMGEV